jgi:hypothetical protein
MERIKVDGGELLEVFRRLLHEGNIRRIAIKQGERTVVEFPLTLGLVGAALAPPLAAVGAMAALLSDCSIEVEREEESAAAPPLTAGEPPPA